MDHRPGIDRRVKIAGAIVALALIVGLVLAIRSGNQDNGPKAQTESGIVAATSAMAFDLQKIATLCDRRKGADLDKTLGTSGSPDSDSLSADDNATLDAALRETLTLVKRYRRDPGFDSNLRSKAENIDSALSDCSEGKSRKRLEALIGQ